MNDTITIAAFYKFAHLPDYETLRETLYDVCAAGGVRGSILLAPEGVNGTVAGPNDGVQAVLAHLRADERLSDIEAKYSYAPEIPFKRLKVRRKKEIITIRSDEADPFQHVGTYVAPEAWNELITRDDVILIDTRNVEEIEYGTFKGAVNPEIDAFGELPDYLDRALEEADGRPVAMFCTGGIRCEKATAYLLSKGASEVYHLKGGILKYLEEIPADASLWEGDCFVFDERVAVDHDLRPVQSALGHT